MEFTFLENALIRGVFTHAPPQLKLGPKVLSSRPIGRRKLLIPQGSVLSKICFPHKQKGVEKITICFTKIQSENIKMTSNIRFFIFCLICNLFKCDGYTVFLLCSHDDWILNIHQKKIATLMKSGIYNKEVFLQFIYKPAQSTEKLFI